MAMTPVEAVRAERAARGWTVSRAATQAGLTVEAWDQFEVGHSALRDDVREGIALAFGWEPSWPDQHDGTRPVGIVSAPRAPAPIGGTTSGTGGAAVAVLIGCLILGAVMGVAVGATRTTDDSGFFNTQWAVMVEQPLGGADKVFNWLLFSLFACAGIIAAAVVWAAGAARRQ